LQAEGTALPFATALNETAEIIGSTRFGNIEPMHKRVEIGWTWIVPKYQRSFVNTEAKFLMLSHAFEVWGVNRVEFKTDVLNERSRRALLRIGAKEEGVMRRHMIRANGVIRDSVYYSIIADEWPEVKGRLEEMLKQ
jgi:RimJ/RimL family protein N-acetyltransferase